MITEIPLELFVPDITNLYYYVYLPEHECATKSGKVYMHRYIMAKHLGRVLTSDEAVHHIDENKINNDLSNLELLTISEHATKHAEEKHGPAKYVECAKCKKVFKCGGRRINKSKSGNLFCSNSCQTNLSRSFEVDVEVLKDLVWSMPTVKVAELFKVSDVAISKRCKRLGIVKPPRGYWRKIQTGNI